MSIQSNPDSQLMVNYRKAGSNKVIVNLNGEDYEVTIFQGQKNVTGDRDWSTIAPIIGELFQTASSQGFEEGNIQLRSNSGAININSITQDTQFRVVSADVKFEDDAHQLKERKLTSPIYSMAIKNLKNLGTTLGGQQAVASTRTKVVTQAPPAPDRVVPAPNIRVPENRITTSYRTIECGGDGRCLNKVIAYQLYKKENPNHNPAADDISRTADELRTRFHRAIIADLEQPDGPDRLYNDQGFLLLLNESLISSYWETLPREIQEILHNRTHILGNLDTQIEARKKLMKYYAKTILDKPESLDGTFMYMLSKINPDNQIVAMQGDVPVFEFPINGIMDPTKVIFVNYDGVGHYKAIDMKDEENKKKLSRFFAKKLSQQIPFLENRDGQTTKQALINMKDNPLSKDIYNKVAELIYLRDLAAWKSSSEPRQFPKPEGDLYGDYRIKITTPEDLVVLLKNLSPGIQQWVENFLS